MSRRLRSAAIRATCAVGALLLGAVAEAAPLNEPTFAVGPRAFAIVGDAAARVRIAWNPVPGAARYRVTWQGVDTLVTTPAFESIEPQPGRHSVEIVALGLDGNRASAPATLAIDIVRIAAIAPGAIESRASAAFAIGTRFSSPGTPCALGAEAAATTVLEVQATTAGRIWLTCGAFSQPMIIAPVLVFTEPRAPLVRETATTIHVTVASVAPLGDRLDVEAIGELDLADAQRTEGGFDLTVTPRANATTVGVRVVAASEARRGGIELGRVSLPLSDKIAATPLVDEPAAWFALELGALAGVFAPPQVGSSASHLGHPTSPSDTVGTSGSLALHAGFYPLRRVGLEAQLAILPGGYNVGSGTGVILTERLQLAVRAVEDHHYGLRLLVGGDVLSELVVHDTSRRATDGGLHYGAAFTIELARDLWVRIEALHLITTSRDAGYASSFVAQVGVVTRFGRRDRW